MSPDQENLKVYVFFSPVDAENLGYHSLNFFPIFFECTQCTLCLWRLARLVTACIETSLREEETRAAAW